MKIRTKIKKGFTLIELLVVIAIMASLGAVGYVAILNFMNAGDKQAAKENIKQVGTALTNFKKNNGSFPCDGTVDDVENAAGGYGDLQGDFANDYFRQLFAKRGAVKEATFFAKIGEGMKEGDDKVANGECLKPGENAFAYVMLKPAETADAAKPAKKSNKKNKKAAEPVAAEKRPITEGPLLFCCVDKTLKAPVQGDQLTFDMDAFGDYAIMYTTDGATKDLEDDALLPDEADDTIGRFHPDYLSKAFPENRRTGDSKAANYIVLPPAR